MTNLGKVGNTDYCCCCTSSSKQRGFCKGMTTKIIPAAVAFGSLRGKNLMGRYGDGRQHREVAWLNWNQFILENRRHRWQSQTHGKKIYNNSAACRKLLLLLLPTAVHTTRTWTSSFDVCMDVKCVSCPSVLAWGLSKSLMIRLVRFSCESSCDCNSCTVPDL